MPGMSADIATLPDILRYLEREVLKPDLLKARTEDGFRPISTAEFSRRVRGLSLGLAGLGLGPGIKVALLSENRPEWIIADLRRALPRAGSPSPSTPNSCPRRSNTSSKIPRARSSSVRPGSSGSRSKPFTPGCPARPCHPVRGRRPGRAQASTN